MRALSDMAGRGLGINTTATVRRTGRARARSRPAPASSCSSIGAGEIARDPATTCGVRDVAAVHLQDPGTRWPRSMPASSRVWTRRSRTTADPWTYARVAAGLLYLADGDARLGRLWASSVTWPGGLGPSASTSTRPRFPTTGTRTASSAPHEFPGWAARWRFLPTRSSNFLTRSRRRPPADRSAGSGSSGAGSCVSRRDRSSTPLASILRRGRGRRGRSSAPKQEAGEPAKRSAGSLASNT